MPPNNKKHYIQIGDYKIPSKLTKKERFWKDKIDDLLKQSGFKNQIPNKDANEIAESVSWNYFQEAEKRVSTEAHYKAILKFIKPIRK